MALIGIAALGFLLLAIIGKRGTQALLKGLGIIIALVAVYLAVGSVIMSQLHPVAVAPAPTVWTPEQLAATETHTEWAIGIFWSLLLLGFVSYFFAVVVRRPHEPPTTLGYGPAPGTAIAFLPQPPGRKQSRLGYD